MPSCAPLSVCAGGCTLLEVEELRASIKETAEKTEEVGKSHQALWQRYKELSNPKNKDAEDRACARRAPCRNPEQMEVPVGT